jgi:hypothetical protein
MADKLTQKQYASIGKVVVEATKLEEVVSEMIATMLELDWSYMDVVLEGKMLGAKLKMLLAAAEKTMTEAFVGEFKLLVNKILSTINKRNIAVHGSWGLEVLNFNHEPFILEKVAFGPIARSKKGAVNPDQLDQVAEEFAKHTIALMKIHAAIVISEEPPSQQGRCNGID